MICPDITMEQLRLDIQGIEPDSLTDRQTDRQPQTLDEKIEQSKKALKLAAEMSKIYYGKPLIVTYSGGKDSDVMLHLAESCLNTNDFEVLNSHTTVDAPETVYHIRKVFKRLNDKGIKTTIDYHKQEDGTNITMWNLIPQKLMPPTRIVRYCCQVLKETGTPNRLCALGVREAESSKRQGRDIFATRGGKYAETLFFSLDHALEVHQESQEIQDDAWDCTLIKQMKENSDTMVNPIYRWLDTDIWDYIRKENIVVNPLYSKGYDRVGCIGCPLASYHQRIKEFNDYPQYKKAYIKAFDKMLEVRREKGKKCEWKTGQEVFDWWIEEGKHNIKGQMTMEDMLNE
jgi:phosphoadenosine phosphosulfate reductase